MGVPGYSLAVGKENLHDEPGAEKKYCRNINDLDEDDDDQKRLYPCKRKKDKIGAKNAGHGAARAHHGNSGRGIVADLSESRDQSGDQIEKEKPDMPEGILNVVAENGKIEHVAEDVKDSSVEKHGRKKGEYIVRDEIPPLRDGQHKLPRDNAEIPVDLIARGSVEVQFLHEEDYDVYNDETRGYNWICARGYVILDRYHRNVLPRAVYQVKI